MKIRDLSEKGVLFVAQIRGKGGCFLTLEHEYVPFLGPKRGVWGSARSTTPPPHLHSLDPTNPPSLKLITNITKYNPQPHPTINLYINTYIFIINYFTYIYTFIPQPLHYYFKRLCLLKMFILN